MFVYMAVYFPFACSSAGSREGGIAIYFFVACSPVALMFQHNRGVLKQSKPSGQIYDTVCKF